MKNFIVCILLSFVGIGHLRAAETDSLAYQVRIVEVTSEELNNLRTNYRAYDAQGNLRFYIKQTPWINALGSGLFFYNIYDEKGEYVYGTQLGELDSLNFTAISSVLDAVENRGCIATLLVQSKMHRLLWTQGTCPKSSASQVK